MAIEPLRLVVIIGSTREGRLGPTVSEAPVGQEPPHLVLHAA